MSSSSCQVKQNVCMRLVSRKGGEFSDPIPCDKAPYNGRCYYVIPKESFTNFKGGEVVLCVNKPSSDEFTTFARGAIPMSWTPTDSDENGIISNVHHIASPIESASGVPMGSLRFIIKKLAGIWLLKGDAKISIDTAMAYNDINNIPWVAEINDAEAKRYKRARDVDAFVNRIVKVARGIADTAHSAASAKDIPDDETIILQVCKECSRMTEKPSASASASGSESESGSGTLSF